MYANTASAEAIVDRMIAYGVKADGEVVGHEYHEQVSYDNEMTLREVYNNRGRITRVRILKEGPYCDISYIHATMLDGTIVPVRLSGMVGNCFRSLKGDFIAWGKEEGVYAKGLGLLDEANWAVLHG